MTLSASQLADLRMKALLLLSMDANDPAFAKNAITVYDDATTNLTSTIAVFHDDTTDKWVVQLNGSVTGVTTLNTTDVANDTLAEIVAVINVIDNGEVARLVYPDGSALSANLTPLAAVSMFGIANEQTLTIQDTKTLDLIIQAAFSSVEGVLGRSLFSAAYVERYQIDGHLTIKLDEPDVTAVSFVGADLTDALTVTYTGAATRATVEVTDTQITLRSRSGVTTTETAITYALNGATTDLKTAIDLIAGWSATVLETMPSAYLARVGVQSVKSEEVTLAGYEDYDWTYSTDYDAGLIEFQTWPTVVSPWSSADWIVIGYTAGFATLPADIEGVILSVVKAGWDETLKDSSVIEERLGDYSYKLPEGATGAALTNLSEHEAILSRYRRWNP